MMSGTPRVFVGATTFLIAGLTSRTDLRAVTAVINGFPGVRVVVADPLAGLVTVSTERPVNRTDVTAAIVQAGDPALASHSPVPARRRPRW